MRRVVAPWLPMEDPGNEARRIVRQGMADILGWLDDEHLTEVLTSGPGVKWGHPGSFEPMPDQVDVVITSNGITFVSAEVDRQMTAWEAEVAAIQRQFHFDMQVIDQTAAFRRRYLLGMSEA